MSKKHKARAQTPAPQTAQVDAVERLLDEGRVHEAAAKADRLAVQFPDHVRLRDLRIRAHASTGDTARAALLARTWTDIQPNSQRAWHLLFGLSADLGLGFLAYACHQRLQALGAADAQREDDAQTLIEAVRAKYAGMSDEEGARSDRGLLFLIGEQLDEAIAELSGLTHSVPLTNLAGAWFDADDMPKAIALARQAWQADEANTHAARILVRALLYSGDGHGAAGAGARLRDLRVSEPDELAAQLETLDLLEDYAAARACHEAFSMQGFDNFRRDMLARLEHAAAVAYYHLGEHGRARVLWQQAVEHNRHHPLYQVNLARLLRGVTDDPAWRELLTEAFPATAGRALHAAIEGAGGGEALLEHPDLLDFDIPGHALYLGCLLRQSDSLGRALVREALGKRVRRGDAEAEAELRRFLVYAPGEDAERIEALRALYLAQRQPASGSVTIHLRGAQRTLTIDVPAVRVSDALPGLPEQAQEDYFASVFADKPGAMRQSLDALSRWQSQAAEPYVRAALEHRILMLLHILDGRRAEGEARLRAALDSGQALARTHAFAARLAIARGDLAGAQSLLAGQLARAGERDEDLAPVLTAQTELHAARGETDAELAAYIARECLGAFSAAQT